jgi:hypothetical protein
MFGAITRAMVRHNKTDEEQERAASELDPAVQRFIEELARAAVRRENRHRENRET